MTQQDREQLEELLSAYLDEELDPEARARVDERLARSPEARETFEQLRQVASLVGRLPRGKAPDDTSEAVLARMERDELVGDMVELPGVPATPPGALSFGRLVGAAAVLLVAVLAGYLAIDAVRQSRQAPIQLADAAKAIPDQTEAKTERPAAPARESAEADESGAPSNARTRARGLGYALTEEVAIRKTPTSAPVAKDGFGAVALARTKDKELARKPSGRGAGERRAPRAKPAGPARQRGRGRDAKKGKGAYGGGTYAATPLAGRPSKPTEEIAETRMALVDKLTARLPSSLPADRPGRRGKRPAAPVRIADRLAAGVTVGELETYTLDREAVQLVLTAPDSDERTQLTKSLRAFFARSAVRDARSLGTSARLDARRPFYLAQSLRTDPQPSETFLMRGTSGQVILLVDELSRSARQDVKVALATPAILAEGWDRANLAARMLRADPTDRARSAKAEGRRAEAEGRRAMAKNVSLFKAPLARAKVPTRPAVRAKAAPAAASAPRAASRRTVADLSSQVVAKTDDDSAARALRQEWLRRPRRQQSANKPEAYVWGDEPVGPPIRDQRLHAKQAAPVAKQATRRRSRGAPEAPRQPVAVAQSLPTQAAGLRGAGTVERVQTRRAEQEMADRRIRGRRAGQAERPPTVTRPGQPASRPGLLDALAQKLAQLLDKPSPAQQPEREPVQPQLVTVIITVKTADAPDDTRRSGRAVAPR